MKINKKRIAFAAVAVAMCLAALTAFANQENNFDSPCEHSFVRTGFSNNAVHIRCEHCNEEQSLQFSDYVGAESTDSDFEPLLDINEDNIINGRDLAYLKNS